MTDSKKPKPMTDSNRPTTDSNGPTTDSTFDFSNFDFSKVRLSTISTLRNSDFSQFGLFTLLAFSYYFVSSFRRFSISLFYKSLFSRIIFCKTDNFRFSEVLLLSISILSNILFADFRNLQSSTLSTFRLFTLSIFQNFDFTQLRFSQIICVQFRLFCTLSHFQKNLYGNIFVLKFRGFIISILENPFFRKFDSHRHFIFSKCRGFTTSTFHNFDLSRFRLSKNRLSQKVDFTKLRLFNNSCSQLRFPNFQL